MMNQQNNNMQMIKQFINFRNNFTGNPKAEVMRLVKEGKINQNQLNELQNMATQFETLINSIK